MVSSLKCSGSQGCHYISYSLRMRRNVVAALVAARYLPRPQSWHEQSTGNHTGGKTADMVPDANARSCKAPDQVESQPEEPVGDSSSPKRAQGAAVQYVEDT